MYVELYLSEINFKMYISNFEIMFDRLYFLKIANSNISDSTCSSRTMPFPIKTQCISRSPESRSLKTKGLQLSSLYVCCFQHLPLELSCHAVTKPLNMERPCEVWPRVPTKVSKSTASINERLDIRVSEPADDSSP